GNKSGQTRFRGAIAPRKQFPGTARGTTPFLPGLRCHARKKTHARTTQPALQTTTSAHHTAAGWPPCSSPLWGSCTSKARACPRRAIVHNHSQMRCATYARFSPGENQREASIHDQLRKCRDYADSKGWTILSEHIYSDQHMSGAGIDRPGLNRLLECAFRKGQAAFDVVLVDDTSRLSRVLADAIRISQRLRFEGIRL